MKKILAMVALLALTVPASLVMARHANRDSFRHILQQQKRQQKPSEAVIHSTGAAKQQALTLYRQGR